MNHKEAQGDGARESERLIVPRKPGNPTRGDPVEGRGRRVAEPLGGNRAGAQEPDPVSTKQQRIAELARQEPALGFIMLSCGVCCVGGCVTCAASP